MALLGNHAGRVGHERPYQAPRLATLPRPARTDKALGEQDATCSMSSESVIIVPETKAPRSIVRTEAQTRFGPSDVSAIPGERDNA